MHRKSANHTEHMHNGVRPWLRGGMAPRLCAAVMTEVEEPICSARRATVLETFSALKKRMKCCRMRVCSSLQGVVMSDGPFTPCSKHAACHSVHCTFVTIKDICPLPSRPVWDQLYSGHVSLITITFRAVPEDRIPSTPRLPVTPASTPQAADDTHEAH